MYLESLNLASENKKVVLAVPIGFDNERRRCVSL